MPTVRRDMSYYAYIGLLVGIGMVGIVALFLRWNAVGSKKRKALAFLAGIALCSVLVGVLFITTECLNLAHDRYPSGSESPTETLIYDITDKTLFVYLFIPMLIGGLLHISLRSGAGLVSCGLLLDVVYGALLFAIGYGLFLFLHHLGKGARTVVLLGFGIILLTCLVVAGAMEIRNARGWACTTRLMDISSAKYNAAQHLGPKAGDTISESQITNNYPCNGICFKCPSGGRYALNPVGSAPTCSLGKQRKNGGHSIGD